MNMGMTVALMLLAIGVALVLLAVPNMGSEVVVSEELTVVERRIFLGPYDLPRGSYSVWLEDFRDIDELGQWNAFLLDADEDVWWGGWPREVKYQEFEGVDSEMTHVIGNVPEGEYDLVLECDLEELNGTTLHVFLVRSTGTVEGVLVATGVALVVVAVVVMMITRRRPGEVRRA